MCVLFPVFCLLHLLPTALWQTLAMLVSHHDSPEFPTTTSPHNSEGSLMRPVQGPAVFSEQYESVHRSELMENTVVSPERFWHRCPKCSTCFKTEPSGSVLPKHEIIVENRKSTEVGESSASGHHAFSCERKMLAFAYTKRLWQS